MRRVGKQLALLLAVIIAVTIITPMHAEASSANPGINSAGAVVIDFETGNVIFGHNEAIQRVPASMVKMIAVYVVFDAIRDGQATMDTEIRISQHVHELSVHPGWSNVRLEVGATHTVRELLEIVIVRSANGATAALGEGIFGSDSALVRAMNAKASQLNIRAHFADSFGISAQNRISPLALAWFMQSMLVEHPEILEFTSMRNVSWQGGDALINTNHLLTRFDGADGLKTGFTSAAMFCVIGTAERGGRRMITVIMGNQTGGGRFDDAETLLSWGFANAMRINTAIGEPRRPITRLGANASLPQQPQQDTQQETPQDTQLVEPQPDIDIDINFSDYDISGVQTNQTPQVQIPQIQTPQATGLAVPSQASLILNGVTKPISAYLIGGSHYFKLRDIAYLLNGTDRQFEVEWNSSANAIHLLSGIQYTPLGGEMVLSQPGNRPFRTTPSMLFFDGHQHSFNAFLIDGNNFFMLRDLASLIGFTVDWIDATRTVTINTTTPSETPQVMDYFDAA